MDKKEVFELIAKHDIGMLTNINESGKLVSHPMTRQGDVKDGVLWFFSERDSEKVLELQKNGSLNVSFNDKDYISVSGEAVIVDDVKIKKELWSKGAEVFFDGGPESNQIVLIKVEIDSLEYWTSDNLLKSSFEFVKSMVTDEKPDVGEHGAVDL